MIEKFFIKFKEEGFNEKTTDLLSKCDAKELITYKELYEYDTKTVLQILKETSFLNNKENIPHFKTIIENMNGDSIMLFNIIEITDLDISECLQILNFFNKIPFVNNIYNLLTESNKAVDYDWEYELNQKEHHIKDLEKQITDLNDPSVDLKPQSKDIFEAIEKGLIIDVIQYIEKGIASINVVNWSVPF